MGDFGGVGEGYFLRLIIISGRKGKETIGFKGGFQ